MDKERFEEIMKKHGYCTAEIEILWEKRPTDRPSEKAVKKLFQGLKVMKELGLL